MNLAHNEIVLLKKLQRNMKIIPLSLWYQEKIDKQYTLLSTTQKSIHVRMNGYMTNDIGDDYPY